MTNLYELLHYYAFYILAVAIATALYVGIVHNNQASHERDVNVCHRLNIVRAETNRNAWLDYQTNSELATIVSQPSLLAKLTPAARAERIHETVHLRANIAQIGWDPLTNCENPVAHIIVPFIKGVPSKSAFILGPQN